MSSDWTVNQSYQYNGKTMLPGTEFAVSGEHGGRFRFASHVVTSDGLEWINCFGGPKGVTMWRSFRPTRITRITRLRPVEMKPR